MIHIYAVLFLIGVLGLLAQTLLGMAGVHGGGHSHAGHAHGGGHGGHFGHGQAHGRATQPQTQDQGGGSRAGDVLLSLLSPLTLFSLCVGIGATGLLLRPLHLTDLVRASLAALGGLLFCGLIVRPLWGLVFRFASTPARALEGTVAGVAEALSRFDGNGKGLVRLTVDGQIVRVLAFLEADDRPDADAVRPGDRLTVISVDGHANTCRVARI